MVSTAARFIALMLACSAAFGCERPSSSQPANAASTSAAPSTQSAASSAGVPLAPSANATPTASILPPGITRPRIMIVGDSISAGPGCYKKFLLQALEDHHYQSFEFVGEYSDDCGSTVRHSAVSCSTALQYTQPSFTMPNCFQGKSFPGMSTLMATHHPDVVMLQLGVNDIWGGTRTLSDILDSYATLVRQARAVNPRVVLVVAQIQKIRPNCDADESITQRAEALVKAVPAWAAQQSSPESPVLTADLWSTSDWSKTETLDCVHPNEVGARKMGLNWFTALAKILQVN